MARKIVVQAEVTGQETIQKAVNAFAQLKSELKAAKGELAGFDVGTAGFEQAQKKVADLTDKLGDLNDASRVNGTGVEKLTASFSLFKESLMNADFDKAKLAFQGLGSAMSALPMFALITGIQLLIENWDKVAQYFSTSAAAATILKDALAALEIQTKANKTAIEGYLISLEAELDQLKQRKAPLADILEKMKQIAEQKKKDAAQDLIENETKKYFAEQELKRWEKNVQISLSAMQERKENIARLKGELSQLVADNQKIRATIAATDTNFITQSAIERQADFDDKQKKLDEEFNKKKALSDEEFKLWQARRQRAEMFAAAEAAASEFLLNSELDRINKIKAAEKQAADIIADLRGSIFLKTVEQGKAQSAFEKQAAQRTLQGKLDALEQEKNAQLASVGDTESAAAAKAEIELQYVEKVKQAKKAAYNEDVKQITSTANQIASVANQLGNMFSQLNVLQQQAAEQRIAHEKAETERQLSELSYNKELRLQQIEDEKIRTLNTINDQYAQVLAGEQLTSDQRQGIEAQKNSAIRKANAKAIRDKQLQENQAAKTKYALDLAMYKSETDAKKKSFETSKKLQIATAVMNTISGSVAAFTGMVAAIPGPYGLIAGALAAAAVAAMGVIQVANIRKQTFEAAPAPTPPVLPSVSLNEPDDEGGAGAGPSARPNRATLFSTGQSQTQSLTPGGSNQPIKAYVVAQEMTTQQQLDASIKAKSTF